ncbi:glycosyltransferase [Cetobacterium somerae]|uniref:glycosyltransferase n=1 Tax=Cetobacterium somerae TaxID=188913 RepID=UPI00211F45C7|nr:glycosyltransferase [Cetobacterium somerae]MCQ9628387.1 glycosyltransferase [Cetobacterium somerae]
MKILFYSTVLEVNSGISKKIKSQIESLQKNKKVKKIISTRYEKNDFFIGEEKVFTFKENNNLIGKVIKTLTLLPKMEKVTLKILKKEKIDYFYIRHYVFNSKSVNFFKQIKALGVNIILEIPTYPYDKEKIGIISKIRLFQEKMIRNKLKKYIDYIVTYSEDQEIYGIKTINISNGINLAELNFEKKEKKILNKIVFTGVAMIDYWHGYDRFIDAIDLFLKNKKQMYELLFNIVGNGNEKEIKKLKEKVKRLNLEREVVFHGSKFGEELSSIYKETDIGVGSLGRHRSGIYTMKALKNREYCAKGIPMIFSEDDVDFRKVPFVYHVSSDEEKIKIEDIIEWYKNLKFSSDEIKEYSKSFSWDIQMGKIIDFILKDRGVEK